MVEQEQEIVSADRSAWLHTAQGELFQGWQRWVSFTCIWIWSCITTRIAFENDLLAQLTGVLSAPNEIVLIASAVALLIIFVFARAIASIVDSKRWMAAASALLTGGSAAYMFGTVFPQTWLFVCGMIAGGFAISLLKIAWGEMYSRMSLRQGLLSMGYSLVASTLVVLLTRDLPPLASTVILVAVAIPCAPLAYAGTRRLKEAGPDAGRSSKQVKFSLSLLLLPVMVALSFGIVKGMLPWLEGAESEMVDVAIRYAEMLVGIALVVSSYFLGRRFGAAQIYAVALIFIVAGLMLFSAQGAPQGLAHFVHEIGFSSFYFFMVVYWGDLSRRTGMPIVLIYTIGYGAFQVIQVIGSMLGYYVVGDPSQSFALIVLLSVVLAFFIVVLLLLSNSRSSLRQWLIADEAPAEQGDEIPNACAALAVEFGLSPREHEVLGLLARGRNASYVARTLYVSPDTAKTHIKNIYRKLDVHTQQELIDRIEAVCDPGASA